ncbi:helix-turn-helix transcriptional regulator [Phytomonospora endophytica]|uniref:Putative DNA-binding transcriptional regulator YafY n=1 Tax=Phytomonospora endophytica TaxID=714109 RepID=A0A841FB22_9ACTN|nr:YafY family protein [Phytomonospora endophytica]MBB6032233.1 putative DNA-binding transcriptional regulator YafY [Phytomonospora endophytica]GIG68582.1 transcriptional regulator [Phytomonospora endophytica]
MAIDVSPTTRVLMVLEMIQASPGITAERLAERTGVSERAVRRHVGILREAGLPIESVRGPYGGYRVGRGLRLPPLMFTPDEALGLVMSVLEGNRGAGDPADPVESALGKILRVLPEPVARPAEAVRGASAAPDRSAATPDPHTTALLGQACAARTRLRLSYRTRPEVWRPMDVDPWAVVVRHGRWYLLCWSHTRQARRVFRIDRIAEVEVLPETFTAPEDLDPVRTLEEHFSEGWRYRIEVLIDASPEAVAEWLPRNLGRLEADGERTRLRATTDEPDWYAEQLVRVRAPFTVVGPPELAEEVAAIGRRYRDAVA